MEKKQKFHMKNIVCLNYWFNYAVLPEDYLSDIKLPPSSHLTLNLLFQHCIQVSNKNFLY